MEEMSKILLTGVDVGSTTVKIVLVDPQTDSIIHSRYIRHNAEQAMTVKKLLEEAHELFPENEFRLALCGSGGAHIARMLGAFFTQEVVANGIAVAKLYPQTSTAIELGGQDAKILFFKIDPQSGKPWVSDMRMNGVCAGGTGAFIDQAAELLRTTSEEFGKLASRGTRMYEISGRCGVFAKTDIQPLLNQGVPREDIALSTFHAIAKQVISGLAQGARIHGPVIFEGGPLTFNETLVRVFRERLNLKEEEGICPENAELLVAYGAALSSVKLHEETLCGYTKSKLETMISEIADTRKNAHEHQADRFFTAPEEVESFHSEFAIENFVSFLDKEENRQDSGFIRTLPVYLGIDAGSTTSKFVILSQSGELLDKFYRSNEGDPLGTVRGGLLAMRSRYRENGWDIQVIGSGSTGYGEKLCATAFKLDFHTVETIAHTRSAREYCPDVSFILDIGGQDMKAIYVKNGIPVNFMLNEACSAGCGSFLETYAGAMGIKVQEIAELAFGSENPSRLGSRCTVFMNSSIITEQKNGKSVSDIMAGLCASVVENALTKVLRVSSYDVFGDHIVVQGGTFRNDAVLRAFQKKLGRKVIRPPHPAEMGAIGAALLTKEHLELHGGGNSFSWERVENLSPRPLPADNCKFCQNNCSRTVIDFGDSSMHIAGNRCEKGEILETENKEAVKARLKEVTARLKSIPDLIAFREKALFRDYEVKNPAPKTGVRIGIPRTLEFWDSMPFWKTFFQTLGYEVVLSNRSTPEVYTRGLASISSDTICLPAKMAHGHILDLLEKKVDRIFNPLVLKVSLENKSSAESWMCPVIQGYAEVVRIHDEPEKYGSMYDAPAFQWDTHKARKRQITDYARSRLGIKKDSMIEAAIANADQAMREFRQSLLDEGLAAMQTLSAEKFGVVVAGRPYHADGYINHGLASHFTSMGIPVLDLESLPGLHEIDLSGTMLETNNAFHTRLLSAGILAARHPHLEYVQVVSFGCGHDAILSDELVRLMEQESGKTPLVLKLDEGENRGPVGIRVRSFVETVRTQRLRASRGESPAITMDECAGMTEVR